MYDRLLRDPTSYRSSPSTTAAVALSGLVVLVALAAVAGLVWATLHPSGIEWFLVALGWACLVVARPRMPSLGGEVRVLDPQDYPGLHGLISAMSTAVGVRPPQVLGVDLDFNAYVGPLGWRGRNAMVLGLPMMSLGSWPERLGVIGHELGHLRGHDTLRGRLVGAADYILSGVHYLVAPDPYEDIWYRGAAWEGPIGRGPLADVTRLVQTVVALPFVLLSWLLDRAETASGQHREYLADRRAAEVVGSSAMSSTFFWDFEGIRTTTASAARRGEDPFAALLGRAAMTSQQAADRMKVLERQSARADETHPLDHLRIKLIQAPALPPSPVMPGEPTWLRAEADLERLRERYRKRFSQELVHGR